MKPNAVIWDFNGTILDDVEIGIESINTLLARRGLPLLQNKEAYQKVFRFPIEAYYADLGLPSDEFETLAYEWMAEYLARLPRAAVHASVVSVLQKISEMNIRQIILSATEQQQLDMQIDELGLTKYFSAIIGNGDIFARTKIGGAGKWRAEHPGRVILIGDTDHDLQTAQSLQAECLLLAIGHQSKEKLGTLGVPVLSDPMQILSYLTFETEDGSGA